MACHLDQGCHHHARRHAHHHARRHAHHHARRHVVLPPRLPPVQALPSAHAAARVARVARRRDNVAPAAAPSPIAGLACAACP